MDRKRISIVGGIFYKPTARSENKDIYGNDINISNLQSYVHNPVQSSGVIKSEYAEPYAALMGSSPLVKATPIKIEHYNDVPAAIPVTISQTYEQQMNPSNQSDNARAWDEVYKQYGQTLGIKDKRAYAYLLGQIQHESNNFSYTEELGSGENYEGRLDLGNLQIGDGKKYKGRGPIQVTGRANYEKIYKEFFVPNGLEEYNIVDNPELAKDPKIGALLTMGWLATTENGKKAIEAANRYDVRGTTHAINGGFNGLNDRIKRTNELLKNIT